MESRQLCSPAPLISWTFPSPQWSAQQWSAQQWSAQQWSAQQWSAQQWSAQQWSAQQWSAQQWSAQQWQDTDIDTNIFNWISQQPLSLGEQETHRTKNIHSMASSANLQWANRRTRQKSNRGDRKGKSNYSPEIPDKMEWDIRHLQPPLG